MFRFQSITSALLMLFLSSPSFLAVAEEVKLQVQRQNDVAYVSGGIGETEQKAIEEMGKDFGLKLTFATKDGHYHGGGHVIIQDSQGNTVLDVPSHGPLFYADLRSGTYTIIAEPAEYPGQSKETVNITAGKQASLLFTWGTTPEPEVLRQ